eukprot:8035804-Heterocapsa_arctica.AAC.1
MASRPRVIKQMGGSSGEGTWIIKRNYDNYYNKFGERNSVDNEMLDMTENDANHSEKHAVAEFIEVYFSECDVKPSAWTSTG